MGRHLAAIAVIVGVLAVPAAAQAKEISKVSVCGTASQCTTYDESDFRSLMFLAADGSPGRGGSVVPRPVHRDPG